MQTLAAPCRSASARGDSTTPTSIMHTPAAIPIELLHVLALGVIMFDTATHDVLFSNPAAERMCVTGDGLRCNDGRLTWGKHDARDRWSSAPEALFAAGTHLIDRGAERQPLIVRVYPLQSAACGTDGYTALVIYDPELPGSLPPTVLMQHYGLSPAELDTALRLCRGGTLQQIADERCRSVETLRSQLKAVLQKTGLRSRAELCRLMASPLHTDKARVPQQNAHERTPLP